MCQRAARGVSPIPPALAGFSCFPMGDSVFGFWLSAISRERRVELTLVNSPLGVQHFAWGSWQFSNRSIVLHGLKGPNNPFWDFAMRRGSGPFVPYPRVCDTCARMGWSSWPESVVNGWRCCGKAEGALAKAIGERGLSVLEARVQEARERGNRRSAKAPGLKALKGSKKASHPGASGETGNGKALGKSRAARPKGLIRARGGATTKSAASKSKGAKNAQGPTAALRGEVAGIRALVD
jgi:hypothetical protein